ncbi:MAG: hypothetical protein K2F63_00305 [Muribaculaceae bacterium]|nr:hypothetical protein [Muribaculaceae bacterium]
MKKHLIALSVFAASAAMAIACVRAKTDKEIDLMVEIFPVQDTLSGKRIDLPHGECLGNMFSYAGDYLIFRAIRAPYFQQIYDRQFNFADTIFQIL